MKKLYLNSTVHFQNVDKLKSPKFDKIYKIMNRIIIILFKILKQNKN